MGEISTDINADCTGAEGQGICNIKNKETNTHTNNTSLRPSVAGYDAGFDMCYNVSFIAKIVRFMFCSIVPQTIPGIYHHIGCRLRTYF